MSDHFDVVIVGGGFTGAALACALADGSRRIAVLEARPVASRRFAGELLHPTAVDELDRLRLLAPLLDAGGVPVEGFAVVRGGATRLLPYAAVPGRRPYGLGIEHATMVTVMQREATRRPGVTLSTGVRVEKLRHDGERVTGVELARGATLTAPLVLVADGRHSKLRPALGIAATSRLVSFTAALRVEDAPLPATAYGHVFVDGPAPMLAYPIAPDVTRVCFDVPVGTRAEALAPLLRARYLPHLPATLAGPIGAAMWREPIELVANHAMRSASLVAPGVALVGDAGGCAHPLTAAGMTVCLRDVADLTTAIERGDFDGYAARHRAFARSRALLTTSLYRTFRGDDFVARRLRDAVFRYWESPRARAASTALLTGADPSLSGFARELVRVAWESLPRPMRPSAARIARSAKSAGANTGAP
jgi:squalene monooxygenase